MPKFVSDYLSKVVHDSPVILRRMTLTQPEVTTLYRGADDLSQTMFCLSTMMVGIWGYRFPNEITMSDIKTHKTTNLSNQNAYFLSMSAREEVASLRSRNNSLLIIDPSLFRHLCIDVHQTYRDNIYTMPGRIEGEAEHVSLATLFYSIKAFRVDGVDFANPFYLSIESDNKEALARFKTFYNAYITLLKNIQSQVIAKEDIATEIEDLIDNLMALYEQYTEANPFTMSIAELEAKAPEFFKRLIAHEQIEDKSALLKDLVIARKEILLETHPHAKTLIESQPFDRDRVMTCYDDPYSSYGQYD